MYISFMRKEMETSKINPNKVCSCELNSRIAVCFRKKIMLSCTFKQSSDHYTEGEPLWLMADSLQMCTAQINRHQHLWSCKQWLSLGSGQPSSPSSWRVCSAAHKPLLVLACGMNRLALKRHNWGTFAIQKIGDYSDTKNVSNVPSFLKYCWGSMV